MALCVCVLLVAAAEILGERSFRDYPFLDGVGEKEDQTRRTHIRCFCMLCAAVFGLIRRLQSCGAEIDFLSHIYIYTKTDRFTKTGSGQRSKKSETRGVSLQGGVSGSGAPHHWSQWPTQHPGCEKRPFFESPFHAENDRSFCQDRLGTNIGKASTKRYIFCRRIERRCSRHG